MEYEFDPVKAESNLSKHGVPMSEGEGVLRDPLCLSMPDGMTKGEQRFVAIGMNLFGQVRVVCIPTVARTRYARYLFVVPIQVR